MPHNPNHVSNPIADPAMELQTLKSAFQHLQEGVLIVDFEKKIQFANPAFLAYFGFSTVHEAENLLFKETNNITFTDKKGYPLQVEKTPFQLILNRLEFQNHHVNFSSSYVGNTQYCIFSGHLINDKNNIPRYGMIRVNYATVSIHSSVDPTSYLKTGTNSTGVQPDYKEKLEQEKNLLQAIIDTIPVMITIYDPEISEIYLNNAVESITGWTNEDARQKSIMELAYPDPKYREEITQFMQSLKPGFKDIVMRTKNGLDIETSWANIEIPDGRQVGIGIEVTDLKKSLQELAKSEERFRNLADNISQFAWMADESGWIFWYNKRWYDYTGTTLKDMEGWGWTKVHHPEHVDRVVEHIKTSFIKGIPWEDIFPLRRKDGEYRWFLSRALPIRDESGNIVRWFGTNTDITKQKQLEDDLKKAKNKAEKAMSIQTAFIQNISHEIRTPMNSILGFTELLQRSFAGEKEKLYVDAIMYNGQQLLRLINDIVDLSRLDNDQLSLSKRQLYLKEIIEQSKQQFEGLKLTLKKEHLSFKLTVPPENDNIVVNADKQRLQQVLTNLISNAVKYTENGFIELGYTVDSLQKLVTFYVKDTGKGIHRDNHHLVFRRFQQFDQSKDKLYGGTGLGLAICKHLVRLFGGKVWFESEYGKGSTFYFTHPFVEQRDVDVMEERHNGLLDTPPDLTGKTILVAEDEEFSFLMLKSMLAETNANVIHAEDGLLAVELFKNHNPDFVFSDIRLPKMNGYEVVKEIKKITSEVPVIALTANALPEEKVKSMDAGFDFHATKPFAMSDLFTLLNRYNS